MAIEKHIQGVKDNSFQKKHAFQERVDTNMDLDKARDLKCPVKGFAVSFRRRFQEPKPGKTQHSY